MTLPAASDPNGPPTAELPATEPLIAAPTPPAPVVYWGDPQMPVAAGPAPGYVFVGFWRRVAAIFIDGLILSVVWTFGAFLLLAPALAKIDPAIFRVNPETGQPLATNEELRNAFTPMFGSALTFYAVMILIIAAYNVAMWAWAGGTIGQRALGVEVRRESDGRRIGFWRALLRYLGYIVAVIPFGIGLLWVGIDPRKQGWHDKIAKTLVVRRA